MICIYIHFITYFIFLVLYVRLPPGFKLFSLSNNNALCSLQNDDLVKNDQLPVKPLAYKNEYCTRIRRMNGENLAEDVKKEKFNQSSTANLNVTSPAKVIFLTLFFWINIYRKENALNWLCDFFQCLSLNFYMLMIIRKNNECFLKIHLM